MAVVLGGIEGCDLADDGFASEEVFPEFLPANAKRGNDAQAGDNDTAIRIVVS